MSRSLPRFLVVVTALAAAQLAAQTAPASEGLGKPCADDVAKLCPGAATAARRS